MKPRIIYIHGNQETHWSFAWAPWLKKELETRGYETFFETMPDSFLARAKYWLPFLKNHIKVGENDVIVGWSTGALAAMRYAEENKIKGSVLVGPSCEHMEDELEKQSGYYDNPWNWEEIKKNQEHVALFYADNDPYIPQEQFKTITEKLSPEVIMVPGAKHFSEQETFPELLEYILAKYQ